MTTRSTRTLVVEADGGSRGNPGVAGYGALVREDGRILRELAAPLGRASNNVAEYTGLIVGLEAARDLAAGEPVTVDVRMDSKLVVEQMSGRWKIKHADMQRLAAQAREIVAEIRDGGGSVTFTWIPRARNKDADALSNEGMDGHHVDRTPNGQAASATDAAAVEGALVGEEAGTSPGVTEEGHAADEREADTEDLVPPPAPLTAMPGAPASGEAPDMSPPVRIVLVRHGVTEYTREGRLDGRGGADPQLTVEGTAQARAAGQGVEAFLGTGDGVRVVTSSLQRARQTGQLIAARLGVGTEVEPDLDELCFGEWEGRTVADISRADPEALQRSRNAEDVPPPGGESYGELTDRVRLAVARLVEQSRENAAEGAAPTLVLVTHRGPIGVILADALGLDLPHVWRMATNPCSMTSIRRWKDGGVVVEFVNDTSHLR